MLIIKNTFLGHFCVTDKQRNGQRNEQTNGKLVLHSCIAAAKNDQLKCEYLQHLGCWNLVSSIILGCYRYKKYMQGFWIFWFFGHFRNLIFGQKWSKSNFDPREMAEKWKFSKSPYILFVTPENDVTYQISASQVVVDLHIFVILCEN